MKNGSRSNSSASRASTRGLEEVSPLAPGAVLEPAGSESQAPALQRGLNILEFLACREQGATLSELSSALNLSPASIFRLTGVLEESGYVRREEPSRRFSLTRKLLLLAQPKQEGRALVECCMAPMREVLRRTGETVQLCCLAGSESVMVEQLPSTHPFKYIVDLGSRPPLHCCAPGKALLASLPTAEQTKILQELKLEKHTARSITTKKGLLDECRRIQSAGYAVDEGEHFEGIHCVAASVKDRHGYPVAAITIAGPSARIPSERFAEFGAIMMEAAREAALNYFG
ncbi:IclR family transcriptional regulator [Verrucomicrobium sp. BvORR034]|uniref:IclR family transcriptional regulator n=1 Tax=Verrucomicrobium sp. BvORR034 TaxID=1396418 RepID=UPI0006799957|nr:IclR family transcriptional regulator [Verrucomicrobium sp. BvORR034]